MSGTDAEVEALRQQLRMLHGTVRSLESELARAQRQSELADALAQAEAGAAARMEQLEPVFDLAAVTRHVRHAIDGAAVLGASHRYVVVEPLLPVAVLRAAAAAVPPAIWLDERPGPREIAVPPKVAPTDAVAVWMFLNDVAKDLIGPALLARAGEPTAREMRLSRSHLVRHDAGALGDPGARAGEAVALLVDIAASRSGRAWAFFGPAPTDLESTGLVRPSHDDGDALVWCVGLTLSGRSVSPSRRRHGDFASWTRSEGTRL